MNELILRSLGLFNGNFPFHSFRRGFDFLLTISISYYAYEYFYGTYEWFNISDYKGILNFFLKGKFFIPFILFLAVHIVTTYIPTFIFIFLHQKKTDRWRNRINILDKQSKPDFIDTVAMATQLSAPRLKDNVVVMRIYKRIKDALTPEARESILNWLQASKIHLDATFATVSKALVAVIIYFVVLPEVGWIFSIITFMLVGLVFRILISLYCFFELIPFVVAKIDKEFTSHNNGSS